MIVKLEPTSGLKYLEDLLKKAKSKDRKQAFIAIDVIQELFLQHLLPEKRKLSSFKALLEGKNVANLKEKELADMHYEHMLRSFYLEFVDILGSCTNDTLEYFRKLAITAITDCLSEKPEQEETLLSLLLNKVGDKTPDVSKHASESTIRLLKKHNSMTSVVVGQIQAILERVKVQALHNYMLLLNKIIFFEDDIDHITSMIKLYFSQFKKLVEEKNEEFKNRILSIILSGINKIVKNLDPSTLEPIYSSVQDQLYIIFKLSHRSSFTVRIECMQLIFQFIKIDPSLNDRFYRTLYKILLSLNNCSALKLDSLFSLLFKALNN